jgi:hypothetical protein
MTGLGFYGTNTNTNVRNEVLPNENEVKTNQLALLICIFGVFIVFSLFFEY